MVDAQNDSAELVIKQVELATAIVGIRQYRQEAQAEIDRLTKLEADLLKRLKQLLGPENVNAIEGPNDEELIAKVAETRKTLWGKVHDGEPQA